MECDICHQTLEEEFAVTCLACGKKFHLRSFQSQEGNCGYAWMRENLCGLAFICAPCFNEQAPGDERR